MKPKWIEKMEEAKNSGAVGVILTANTGDRVYYPEEKFPVANLQYFLAQYFMKQGYRVGYYSFSTGLKELNFPQSKREKSSLLVDSCSEEPARVLSRIGRILRKSDHKDLILIDYADHIAPTSPGMTAMLTPSQLQALEILHNWGQDDAIRATQNFVVLVSHENAINPIITQGGGYRTIQLDLPSQKERAAFIRFILEKQVSNPDKFGKLDSSIEVEEFACITGGLRLIDIEKLFRLSGARNSTITREDVREAKRETISNICRGLVEVVEPVEGFEAVAGAFHAKEYFSMIRALWYEGHKSLPQAILLAGVPGCGKSHLVLALSKELSCPCLVMRGIREAWVGASERNLDLVLWVTENLAPCILWTDEVDQALGQRGTGPSGDSGTSERMLARIFEFFGSMKHRGRILWVATTNRPDVLDTALLDRFQVIIPFLHPTSRERAELLKLLAKQVGRTFESSVSVDEIASMPNLKLLTIRSLQEIIVAAALRSDAEKGSIGSPVGKKHLMQAAEDYKPTFNPFQHEFIALKALEMTSFNSLLPWMSQKGLRKDAEFPEYLEGIVDKQTGILNMSELSKRLRELQQLLFTQRMMR